MVHNLKANSEIDRCPVCGMPLNPRPERTLYDYVCIDYGGKNYCFCSEFCKTSFLENPRIAYFSMGMGIVNEIPTYSGGLAILAGDVVRSSADLRLQMVAVTLVSRKGYLKQKLTTKGEQLDYPDEWDPSRSLTLMAKTITLRIECRDVTVQAWLYEHQSLTGGIVPILFLDTDIECNSPEDRTITDYLYGGDEKYRLKQEMVLGIGGRRLLKELFFNIRKYHMNEGHSSLLTLELLKENNLDSDKVKNLCIFTTHTPVEAAFDKFPYKIFQNLMGDEFSLNVVKKYGGKDILNMTYLGSNLSKYINGVSEAHMAYSTKLFPGNYIRSITNGVHSYTWSSPPFKEIYDKHISGWVNEPIRLVRVNEIQNNEIWDAHIKAKKNLVEFINKRNSVAMDTDLLTIGFARRVTAYKRAAFIFSELDRLKKINKKGRIQLIFAGKAHPRDICGKEIIQEIFTYQEKLENEVNIVYLENYDLDMATKLTSGVDVWLNTPLPPYEASGTSGMKAAHNGIPSFSILDGWWIEGCSKGITRWAIGPQPNECITETERRKRELDDLYNKLEYLIIPTFYTKKDEWITIMKNVIGKVVYYFQSHSMMRRYITEAYLP
ncbi:MAG: alpha-glucan family phosphorylase [Candidatus Bathyarchaeota archaeon]